MKRKVALFFVSLAMVTMVCHTVFPHHHHGALVCFDPHHTYACVCGYHHECESSDACTCHHHHDGEESCPLFLQFYLNSVGEDFAGQFSLTEHFVHILWGMLPENLVAQLPERLTATLDFDSKETLLSQGVVSITGLRAPPACA